MILFTWDTTYLLQAKLPLFDRLCSLDFKVPFSIVMADSDFILHDDHGASSKLIDKP